MAEVEEEKASQALSATTDVVKQAGLDPQRTLRRGEAGTVICEVAKEIGADLIVIGSRGWNPLKRLLLGSTSTYVLYHADSPVLVARADELLPTGEEEL
jgi:nucleotide-binding universal stress UspA family protein